MEEPTWGLGCPFFDQLDFRASLDGGDTVIELDVRDDMRGPGGALHGGLVSMLVDVAGAVCLTAESGRLVATANASIQYLAAGRAGPVRATGHALRVSSTIGAAEVRVIDVGKDDRSRARRVVRDTSILPTHLGDQVDPFRLSRTPTRSPAALTEWSSFRPCRWQSPAT